MGVAEIFVNTVNSMTPDVDSIYLSAKSNSLGEWKALQSAMVTGSGAASVAIPGLHLAGIAADIAFVINRMGVSTFGVGAIIASSGGLGNILEEEDFGAVLAYWADADDLRELMKGKGASELTSKIGFKVAKKIGGKSAGKILTKTMLSSAGYMVGRKLGGKGLAKAAAKFSGKFVSKSAAGFFPFLGPIIGGGVNLWLISSIMDSAEEFYRDKISLIAQIENSEIAQLGNSELD